MSRTLDILHPASENNYCYILHTFYLTQMTVIIRAVYNITHLSANIGCGERAQHGHSEQLVALHPSTQQAVIHTY